MVTTLREKLKFKAPAEFLNPLAQIFFFVSLVNGLVFTFLSGTGAVQGISLAIIAPYIVVPFGIVLLVLSAANLYVVTTEHYSLGTAAAMLGFVTWLYVVILYLIGGLWLAMIIYPLPQVAFWSWYFFMVRRLKAE